MVSMAMKSVSMLRGSTVRMSQRRSSNKSITRVQPRAQENSGSNEPEEKQDVSSQASSEPVGSTQATNTPSAAGSTKKQRSFNEVMAFNGWAPERINGRLAMIGFLAGVGAELAAGESFPYQFKAHFVAFAAHAAIFSLASFMPTLQGSATYESDPTTIPKSQIVGPFTEQAEMFNGRGAMIGMASILIIETIRGGPLFA